MFFKDKKPKLGIPTRPPITAKDHRTITITREDASTYQDDLAEFLNMVNTLIDGGYSEPDLYFLCLQDIEVFSHKPTY